MKTWEQVVNAIHDDLFSEKHEVINENAKSLDEMYSKEYVEFAHEVEYYLNVGLKEIGAKQLEFVYSGYRFNLFFEYENNEYLIDLSRWGGYCTIYAIPENLDKTNCHYFYGYKHRDINFCNVLNPKELFKNIKLPKHAKYKVGDLVYINKKILKTYYGTYHKHRLCNVYKIIKVSYKSNAVWYSLQDIKQEKPDNYFDSYAETNLTKFEGGI